MKRPSASLYDEVTVSSCFSTSHPDVGIIGFGAFGRLVAGHLAPYARLRVYDPQLTAENAGEHAPLLAGLPDVARCPIVILAVPVPSMIDVIRMISAHLRPGALVVDVGSVKMVPVQAMIAGLPSHVEILGTHPLFGPQSASRGLEGLRIAVCPIRGRLGRRVAAFLRRVLRLKVIVTTAEAHDRDAATVQGLTHLIAQVLIAMEPLPTQITTRSFEAIMSAVEMVRHDAPEVLQAIERMNPYAPDVRRRFFALAAERDRTMRPLTTTADRERNIMP